MPGAPRHPGARACGPFLFLDSCALGVGGSDVAPRAFSRVWTFASPRTRGCRRPLVPAFRSSVDKNCGNPRFFERMERGAARCRRRGRKKRQVGALRPEAPCERRPEGAAKTPDFRKFCPRGRRILASCPRIAPCDHATMRPCDHATMRPCTLSRSVHSSRSGGCRVVCSHPGPKIALCPGIRACPAPCTPCTLRTLHPAHLAPCGRLPQFALHPTDGLRSICARLAVAAVQARKRRVSLRIILKIG